MSAAAASRPRAGVLLVVLVAATVLAGGGAGSAMALLTDSEQVAASTSTSASFTRTTYWLHNNPTPPTADTNAQANLGMTTTAPSAVTLFNYDVDRDAQLGRVIARGGSGPTEADLAKDQNWRGPTAGALGQTINGTVTVEFWSASPSFTAASAGEVVVYLRDYNTLLGLTAEIANTTVSAADWQGGASGWVKRTASISVNTTLLVGHALELKLIVGAGSAGALWFAYDTTQYRSRLRLP